MHLLTTQPGVVPDGTEALDLGQTPGDIIVLSAADTELAMLAAAAARRPPGSPAVRLANILQLGHHMSVDTYVEAIIVPARVVIVRLLGGASYWRYGIDEIAAAAGQHGIALALLPGDDRQDGELRRLSTVGDADYDRLWSYLIHGGRENADNFLVHAAALAGHEGAAGAPAMFPRAGYYWPGEGDVAGDTFPGRWTQGQDVALIHFYRALVQAGDTRPVDALVLALAEAGLNPLPLYSQSLKDPAAAVLVEETLATFAPAVIVNATGFAVSSPGADRGPSPFDEADCPILQVVLSGETLDKWQARTRGLAPRDIAMNVALPEVDGRILARAISFKAPGPRLPETEISVVTHQPVADRIAWTARLAGSWVRLRRTPARERRVAIILANYPGRDSRLANGVGLDTPASAATIIEAMRGAGYRVDGVPFDGAELIGTLKAGPTNRKAGPTPRQSDVTLPLDTYQERFGSLRLDVRETVLSRWGEPEDDPFFSDGAFHLAVHRWDNLAIGIQPTRGYDIDPATSYHDPDLVPPHAYLAFYMWLSGSFDAHAVIHLGKHGNLEWLPGKALALSSSCLPEAAFAPLPHLYPFIVNDPGEGTQAKRRTSAVIVDHLTPPLARAGAYGELETLERLVDEYYEASQTDPRRLDVIATDILELLASSGLEEDCGITGADDMTARLTKLDGHLCEIKELQIRDGLHIFGRSPEGSLANSSLVALARAPRGDGKGSGQSITRALAHDLALEFDPLDMSPAVPWKGPRPDVLAGLCGTPWRTTGDTLERLESLALALIDGTISPDPSWSSTARVMDDVENRLRPALQACGTHEIDSLLAGLDGSFVEPGPSGAPTRGRPEVLPTGRNFYSVDTRSVPTSAAWRLGWMSANRLVERHLQDHGEWPRAVALSAWGTATMRTGGDDIAQALALMGVQPSWDTVSGRVTGYEIMPAGVLGRPRVDVTLRVSGFFRDAFPSLVDLVDAAARAVAALDEPANVNPLAAMVRNETADAGDTSVRHAATRVFGSMPGAYGAGLQALIDSGGWDGRDDLARAYVAWSGFAYGAGAEGEAAHALLETRLRHVEAVIHNQDNREHDLLDSDDYYQFEGGLAAAVGRASGRQPAVYHNDHSRPENPRIGTLKEEIARVVRGRVVNPKWIAGVMRHGYKGAFEMAATVDYLFGFAATTGAVPGHHFDAIADAWLDNAEVRAFLEGANPEALTDIAERLHEAFRRGLWTPRRNSTIHALETLLTERDNP